LFCYVSVDQFAHYLQHLGSASDAEAPGELYLQSSEQQNIRYTTGVATVQLTNSPASRDSHFLISTHRRISSVQNVTLHARNTDMQPSTKTCPDIVGSRFT
ncbi:unnamed protein product, partial [Ectocarpus sp. 12 AP-2014]